MMSNSEARKRLAAACSGCGPGYRVGDDGCRHAAANEPSADVEALADVIGSEIAPIGGWLSLTRAAEAVIASDWLAAHTAAAREKALRDAAKEARERGDIGRPGCVEVWDWLDARADREAGR